MSKNMRRGSFVGLALAAATVAGCASLSPGEQAVTITRAESYVASCEKVAEIRADGARNADQVTAELGAAARSKKANTVLLTDSEGVRGIAYRCAAPSAASAPATGK
jgi:ABC-type phosphate transport system substrate-binding protein